MPEKDKLSLSTRFNRFADSHSGELAIATGFTTAAIAGLIGLAIYDNMLTVGLMEAQIIYNEFAGIYVPVALAGIEDTK